MVEPQPSKLMTWVRFPPFAPIYLCVIMAHSTAQQGNLSHQSITQSITQNVKSSFVYNGASYTFFSIQQLSKNLGFSLHSMPFSMRILLENMLSLLYESEKEARLMAEESQTEINVSNNKSNQNYYDVIKKILDIAKMIRLFPDWLEKSCTSNLEILFRPQRVLMQDLTGVPAIVDLISMREAAAKIGVNPSEINPSIPVDLVIDHSVQVDFNGSETSMEKNVLLESERNKERYRLLKWAQDSFSNLSVVPPGTGICHQINLENIASVAFVKRNKIAKNKNKNEGESENIIISDFVLGTDSHTTMINSLGVLGWGVGGIEAEAAMLGQSIIMIQPDVIGVELVGEMQEHIMATDVVLLITQKVRELNVVGKFVEFFGSGLDNMPVADRATIANMAPEYGATCSFFPIDSKTIEYLRLTGRTEEHIALVEKYAKTNNMWRNKGDRPMFTQTIQINLSQIKLNLSGPKRPQDRVPLDEMPVNFLVQSASKQSIYSVLAKTMEDYETLQDGSVAIAAITSCTNTSNPSVMIAAGLVAKKACELGINVKPFVKTSLSPGSKVVTKYLQKSGLMKYLNQLGFNVTGYGCMTCIGNSGPLLADVENALTEKEIDLVSVLSGNRNFEGRVHNLVKYNYLASPPLVVLYAIAGNAIINIEKDQITTDKKGNPIFMKDLYPSRFEIAKMMKFVTQDLFLDSAKNLYTGEETWQNIKQKPSYGTKMQTNMATKSAKEAGAMNHSYTIGDVDGKLYDWDKNSTYIANPPYFNNLIAKHESLKNGDTNNFAISQNAANKYVNNARCLLLMGDSVTTDHISPAGKIARNSAAAAYLLHHDIAESDFNSYGSRRGNHNIMIRGTFANVRIKNNMIEQNGPYSIHIPSNEISTVYDVATKYNEEKTDLIIIAGKEYGTGSSRDWAAKGTKLLGVKAVVAQSFERIHRSNLVGMGVLPLQFLNGETAEMHKITGFETFSITSDLQQDDNENGSVKITSPRQIMRMTINYSDNTTKDIKLMCCIYTNLEMNHYNAGGMLNYVMEGIADRCSN